MSPGYEGSTEPEYEGPSNENEMGMFLHCGLCLIEKPDGVSPRDWCRHEVGWTRKGLQIWCLRHNVNVCHIDFQGCQHPANLTRKKEPTEE